MERPVVRHFLDAGVHDENYLVEIVDDNNKPSAPGAYGRIIVTALANYAMPLLRYDTEDIAQALEGHTPGAERQNFHFTSDLFSTPSLS